jgi:hypothetical protein
MLAALFVVAAASAMVAFFVGRGFRSPSQVAAAAKPPAPTVITAPVQLVRPRTGVVLRGTLSYNGSVVIPAPASLDGSLPAVTASPMKVGSSVTTGTVVAAVANRPVIALVGNIPAYDDMGYGSTGPDVAELQRDLQALGFTIGSDTSGWYGLGTSAAVNELYLSRGFHPILRPATLPNAKGHRGPRIDQLATIPRGEVVFVASLPATLVRAASVGAIVGRRGVAQLASGALRVRSTTDENTASLAHVGEIGKAISNQKAGGFRVRLIAVHMTSADQSSAPSAHLVLAPVSVTAASKFVGENLAVHLQIGASGSARLVVPVSAVFMRADGRAVVITLHHGRQVAVPVIPGIAYAGKEVVTPRATRLLHSGVQVVVGT